MYTLAAGNPEMAALIEQYAPFMDTVSKRAMYQMSINSAERGVLKEDFADYDYDTNRPTKDMFIDFSKVYGPEIIHFIADNDTSCLAS